VASLLETRAVISTHQPVTAAGHASTQFELIGPDGEPPLMYQRTIAAHAEDGRWSWHESGEPLPFEHPERYAARLTRARLDRTLLTEYLAVMGIHVDDDAAYTEATFITQRVSWKTRKQTLDEARTSWMLDIQR